MQATDLPAILGTDDARLTGASPDALPDRADVVVVGGGLPGVAAARFLAQAGVDVVLLEGGPRLGAGSSGRAPGLAWTGPTEHAWRLESSLGANDAGALLRFAREGLDLLHELAPLSQRGLLWAAVEDEREPDELRRSRASLARFGLEAELYPPKRVNELTAGAHFGPALWLPWEGWFEPGPTLATLADQARTLGARLFTGAEATGLATPGDGVTVVVGRRQTLQAEIVVLAAEAGLPRLDDTFATTLHPYREQAILVPGDPAHTPTVGFRAGFGYTMGRPVAGGGVILAGCRWATPHLESRETDDTVVVPAIQERLEATRDRFLPGLSGTPTARWSWIGANGCDGLPLVGPLPGNPRILACAGFGGNEAGMGVRAARGVVDGLLTGRAEGVPDRLQPGRML